MIFIYTTLLRYKNEGNNKMQQLNEPAKLCSLSGKVNPVDNNLTGAVCRKERERESPLQPQSHLHKNACCQERGKKEGEGIFLLLLLFLLQETGPKTKKKEI